MLRFQWIELKNFMSVGNDGLRFDYKLGLTYVYGENHDVVSTQEGNDVSDISNGSGKTVVLVDAPLFALYGRTQRKIKKTEIINIQNDSNCEVRLCFLKDKDEYIIERGLKPDKILIIKNGIPESEEAKKRHANRIIEEEILDGISFDVFKNLIVLNGTSSKHFFEYGKQEKRTFINEVFRLGFLDYLQEELTTSVKEKKAELEKYEIQKIAKTEEIQRLKSLFEASENGEIIDVSTGLQSKIREEQDKADQIKKKIQTLETTFFGGSSDQYLQKYEYAKKAIEETNHAIIRLDANINNLREKYQSLLTQYNTISSQQICPQCTQTIPDSLKIRLYNDLEQKKADLFKIANETKLKKDELEEKMRKMKEWISSAKEAIEEHKTSMSNLQNSMILLQEYQNQLNMKPAGVVNMDKIQEEISSLEKSFQDFLNEMDCATKDFAVHKVCRDVVGGKNFYGYYISVFRKYLNKAINEYLEKMLSPHRVRFNNDLEADVFDGDTSIHSYDNLSTGEKSKVNLALLLSFFDVLHAFHRMETSLLVLDEVLDLGIDSVGIKMLHSILKEKAKQNPHLGIYVVSHKDSKSVWSLQEDCGKVVFERRMGFTTIKENV